MVSCSCLSESWSVAWIDPDGYASPIRMPVHWAPGHKMYQLGVAPMKRFYRLHTLVAIALLCTVSAGLAATKLPSVIGDNMVRQREMAVPVWGWDTAGTQVTVTLGE